MTLITRRWLRFNVVGLAGIAVQLATVQVLTMAGAGITAATTMGVAAAVVHNFLWHRRWTWRDRDTAVATWRLLARFAAANGAVSLAGNVAITWTLVTLTPAGPVAANAVAIAACGLANFWTADRIVFDRDRKEVTARKRKETGFLKKPGFRFLPRYTTIGIADLSRPQKPRLARRLR